MVLHNAMFLLLGAAVYLAVVGPVATRIDQARGREIALILNSFSTYEPDSTTFDVKQYDLTAGSAADFGLAPEAEAWMRRYSGRIWQREPAAEHAYKYVASTGRFYRVTLPMAFYSELLGSVKQAVFAGMAVVYVLIVLVLELVVLPRFLYQPMGLMLAADAATRAGDRVAEIVDARYIPGDELGQIIRSRNETVTALRQREDELERAKHHLEAQDRLASLGLLSASVAHEMNTPLAVLDGSLEQMLETSAEPRERARLERMRRVAARLRRISASLLDFARERREESGPVALAEVVDEAWRLVEIDEKAARVEYHNEVEPAHRVRANADRLGQVFVNLLQNALHAAPDAGGRIRVASQRTTLDGAPAIAVTVEDNGAGIPPEVLNDLFEAFVSTRLDARGTGLGLTVAEGIVHRHGGTITARNCPGGGARLEVTLPEAGVHPTEKPL